MLSTGQSQSCFLERLKQGSMTSKGANLVDKTLKIMPHSKQGETEYVKRMEIVYIKCNLIQTSCCTGYTIETWSFFIRKETFPLSLFICEQGTHFEGLGWWVQNTGPTAVGGRLDGPGKML